MSRVRLEPCMGDKRNTYKILVGNPERKRPLGRYWRRWEDTRIDLKEIMCEDVDWILLSQDRDQWQTLVNTVMKFQVPLSKITLFHRMLTVHIQRHFPFTQVAS
jgi:hypothetical protein